MLIHAVLKEDVDVSDPADPYRFGSETQHRELALVDGVYTIRVWRRVPGDWSSGVMSPRANWIRSSRKTRWLGLSSGLIRG